MKLITHVEKAVDKMYHEFGFKKTVLVAASTIGGSCLGFFVSAAKIPDCPIIDTITKEN